MPPAPSARRFAGSGATRMAALACFATGLLRRAAAMPRWRCRLHRPEACSTLLSPARRMARMRITGSLHAADDCRDDYACRRGFYTRAGLALGRGLIICHPRRNMPDCRRSMARRQLHGHGIRGEMIRYACYARRRLSPRVDERRARAAATRFVATAGLISRPAAWQFI